MEFQLMVGALAATVAPIQEEVEIEQSVGWWRQSRKGGKIYTPHYTGPFLDKLAIVPGAGKTINTWDPAARPLIVNRTRFQ